MIEILELTKKYGEVPAVDEATFSAAPGRITGFLGLNGSGKTTTMRILRGLCRATSGTALINGTRYRSMKIRCGRSVRCSSRASATPA